MKTSKSVKSHRSESRTHPLVRRRRFAVTPEYACARGGTMAARDRDSTSARIISRNPGGACDRRNRSQWAQEGGRRSASLSADSPGPDKIGAICRCALALTHIRRRAFFRGSLSAAPLAISAAAPLAACANNRLYANARERKRGPDPDPFGAGREGGQQQPVLRESGGATLPGH